MNDLFRLRNILHTIRNPRDLDSWFPKTVCCGLEILAYKGLQLWQQLPANIKKSSSLQTSSVILSSGKTLNAHVEYAKHTLDDLDSYKKILQKKFT